MSLFGTPAFADEVKLTTPAPIVQYCSCVAYVRQFLPTTPRMNAVDFQYLPRTYPAVGRIALFNYDGVWHVAYIMEITNVGFWVAEANYDECKKGYRFVKWADQAIEGFIDLSPI